MSYRDEYTLRARLSDTIRGKVVKNHFGDKGYYDHQIGNTKVHLEQGLVYAEVSWGIDGLDYPVSPDVAKSVDMFEITSDKLQRRAAGIYTLRSKNGNVVLARALIHDHSWAGERTSKVTVAGKERKDVVKLFELIKTGQIRPDVEQVEFKQIEGSLGELKRLRHRVTAADAQIANQHSTIASLNQQLDDVRRQLADAHAAATRK